MSGREVRWTSHDDGDVDEWDIVPRRWFTTAFAMVPGGTTRLDCSPEQLPVAGEKRAWSPLTQSLSPRFQRTHGTGHRRLEINHGLSSAFSALNLLALLPF